MASFDDLKKVAEKVGEVRDLPEEIDRVKSYEHRWSKLNKAAKDQTKEIEKIVVLFKKYEELREKLHHGVPQQIDDSLQDILFIGANTKTTAKSVKRVEV